MRLSWITTATHFCAYTIQKLYLQQKVQVLSVLADQVSFSKDSDQKGFGL